MTEPMTAEARRSFVIERIFAWPPEKLWRALTESQLLAQWLLNNDFEPVEGRQFQFRNDPMPHWDGVIDCKVLIVDPLKQLSYTWSALGLESVVLFTLSPAAGGTNLRMEQSGFRADQDIAFKGAQYGWHRFLTNMERVLGGVA